jgi:hypothetical protein
MRSACIGQRRAAAALRGDGGGDFIAARGQNGFGLPSQHDVPLPLGAGAAERGGDSGRRVGHQAAYISGLAAGGGRVCGQKRTGGAGGFQPALNDAQILHGGQGAFLTPAHRGGAAALGQGDQFGAWNSDEHRAGHGAQSGA